MTTKHDPETLRAMVTWQRVAPSLAAIVAVVLAIWFPGGLMALSGFAWPIVVLVACVLFHTPLVRLIDRIKKVGKDGIEWGNMPAPEEPKSKPGEPSLSAIKALVELSLSEPAKTILATLGHYQVHHFQDREDVRWWMVVPRESPDWQVYSDGAAELIRMGLIIAEPPNWRTYLTNSGLQLCKQQRAALEMVPRIDKFGPLPS